MVGSYNLMPFLACELVNDGTLYVPEELPNSHKDVRSHIEVNDK